MFEDLPSRPFGRTHGSLDAFVARLQARHIADEAAPGMDVDISGWIIDPELTRVEAAWVEIAGRSLRVDLDRKRPDVAKAYTLKDRSGAGIGFTTVIHLPKDIPVGIHEARVVGRKSTGGGVYSESARRICIACPRVAPRRVDGIADVSGANVRVGDTQSAPYTLGRGAETVRAESSLRLRGRVSGAARLHVTAVPKAGEIAAWEVCCAEDGRFDAVLWTGDLERGLYQLTVATVDSDERATAVRWCEIAIAGPHYLSPLHLGRLHSSPHAGIMHYADAAPRPGSTATNRFIAGRPIAVAGWCLDPVARMRQSPFTLQPMTAGRSQSPTIFLIRVPTAMGSAAASAASSTPRTSLRVHIEYASSEQP